MVPVRRNARKPATAGRLALPVVVTVATLIVRVAALIFTVVVVPVALIALVPTVVVVPVALVALVARVTTVVAVALVATVVPCPGRLPWFP